MRHPEETTHTLTQEPQPGLFRRAGNWLFSKRHFHFKLLSGTAVGVTVIVLLASTFLYVTLRNRAHETLRSHTIEVIRLSSLIENDISALETGHRGFLLTGDQTYVAPFQRRRDQIERRLSNLRQLIKHNDRQARRVNKVQEVVREWINNTVLPEINAHGNGLTGTSAKPALVLGNTLLDQAREALQSLQDEERIVLNQRMAEQEWAAQSTQILDFLPKLERSVIEMEKEKRGYLLTSEPIFAEAYRRAITDFSTYNGYLSILVANAPSQAEALANIKAQVERWVEIGNSEIETKRTGKDPQFTAGNSSEGLMSSTRQMLNDFETTAMTDYEARTEAASRERIIKTSALATLAMLAVALLAVSNSYSFVLVRRQLAELDGVEARIRSIIDNILDGMITVDETGMIHSINPAAEEMFGYKAADLKGYKFSKLVPKLELGGNDRDAKPVNCTWTIMEKRTGTATVGLARTRNLVTFPVEISLSQMEVENRKLFIAMVRNVTEQKQFEKEIAAEKESLAVTLRSIGDGVITTDVQGNILMLNNEAERLTGWTSAEAAGKPLKTVFVVALDLAAQGRAQRSGYRTEAQSILLSLPETANLTSRDGTEYVIEELASPMRDSKNEVAGVVLVFRDITERQRNEAERRKAETLEQLGLLAGGIAHDFNNLLTAIIGNISLASLLLPPDDELATRLVDAKNASTRARDLAQQLLTFARGGAPIKKTASIGKLIQDTVSFSLRGSHSRSEFSFGSELWPAEIDPGQISQVIGNLVVNADQAMPNGGTLRVSCDNFRYDPSSMPAIADLA
ncbi:MAG TPA: CHASE3 domain-containing protein, partial [Chthoniobacterales bacterium]